MTCKTVTTNVAASPTEPRHPKEILIFSANNAEDFQCACDHIATHDTEKFIGVIVIDRRKLPAVFDITLLGPTQHKPCLVLCKGYGDHEDLVPTKTLYPIFNIHPFSLALETTTNSVNFQQLVCNFILKRPLTVSAQPSKPAAPRRATAKRGRSLDDENTHPTAIHRGDTPSPKETGGAPTAITAAGGSPESSSKIPVLSTFEKEAKPLSPRPPAIEPT